MRYPIDKITFKLIDSQVKKFTFRSSRLRSLIEFQLEAGKGDISALNTVRHYVNSKGVCPYDELWAPIEKRLQRKYANEPKKLVKQLRLCHHKYNNFINSKIYAYTLKLMHKKLTSK